MLDLKTHVESTDGAGRRHVKLVKPYLRFHEEGGPEVYLQKGKFYGRSRREMREKDLPEWLWKHIEASNPDRLKECGMTDVSIGKIIRDGQQKELKANGDEVTIATPRPRGRPQKN